jgi:hypothetical protein
MKVYIWNINLIIIYYENYNSRNGCFFISINSQAQIKNVKSEVKETTVTTVKILTDKKINKNTRNKRKFKN